MQLLVLQTTFLEFFRVFAYELFEIVLRPLIQMHDERAHFAADAG